MVTTHKSVSAMFVVALMAFSGVVPNAHGAIVTPVSNGSNHAAFDSNASGTDLVNTGQATLSSAVISSTWFGAGGHNDGSSANNTTNSTFIDNGRLPGTITYTLNTSVNTLGYDITEIRSITGWSENSTTHANQDFDVEVSLVGSGSFANIQTVTFLPFNGTPANANKSSMVTVTDSTGVIASGVDQLRFTYRQTGGWGGAAGLVIRELDVEGAATAGSGPPPPASAPISAMGWNVDFILGSGETHGAHQKPENANIWFAEDSTVGVLGLPASGAVTAAGVDYQLQPYTGGTNNALRSSGTLTLDSPGKFSEISLLGSNTGGTAGSPWELVLNFADGPSSSAITYPAFGNWAGSGPGLNPQLTGNGTSAAFGGQLNTHSLDLDALGFSSFTLASIDFSSANGAGGNLAVFGLSGVAASSAVIPEPVTMAALGLAVAGLGGYVRKRRRC